MIETPPPPKFLWHKFIQPLVDSKKPVTVFLLNGVKLQGVIDDFDSSTLILGRDGHFQAVERHGISTVMPNVARFDGGE